MNDTRCPSLVYNTSGLLYTNILFTHQIYQYLSSFVPKRCILRFPSDKREANLLSGITPTLFGFSVISKMGNFLWSLIELVVLIFIGWPVAGFCAMIYIFVAPFDACISGNLENLSEKFTFRLSQADRYTQGWCRVAA